MIRVEAPACISQRPPVNIMESDTDTALKKAGTIVKAGLKTSCSFRIDSFACKPIRERIEI